MSFVMKKNAAIAPLCGEMASSNSGLAVGSQFFRLLAHRLLTRNVTGGGVLEVHSQQILDRCLVTVHLSLTGNEPSGDIPTQPGLVVVVWVSTLAKPLVIHPESVGGPDVGDVVLLEANGVLGGYAPDGAGCDSGFVVSAVVAGVFSQNAAVVAVMSMGFLRKLRPVSGRNRYRFQHRRH